MYRKRGRCAVKETAPGASNRSGSTRGVPRGHRRTLMLVTLTVAVSLLFAMALVGCGGSSSGPSVVVFGTAFQVAESLNPNADQFTFTSDNAIYEHLVDFNAATNAYAPSLAEKWETSGDGLTWTFHMRQGVKFQDGSVCDANAFKQSYDLAVKGPQGYKLAFVDSVTIPDASTVVLKLKTPYAVLDIIAATPFVVSPTAIQKYGDQAYQPGNGAGTGPYMLKAVSTTVECTLQKNLNYWGGWKGTHANAPDVYIIRSIPEAATRVQNLKQGVVQIMSPVPLADAKGFETSTDLDLLVQDGPSTNTIHFNTKLAPTDDLNFRLALFYACPFEDIVQLAYSGYAKVGSGFLGPNMYGYDKQVAQMGQYKQDMAKAKEYLAKSKYPNGGVTISALTDNASPECMKIMELYTSALAQLNITLQTQPIDVGVMFEEAMVPDKRVHNIYTTGKPGLVLGVGTLEMDFGSSSAYNFTSMTDPKIDQLIADAYASATSNKDKMVADVIEADKWVRENVPEIAPAYGEALHASIKNVIKGFMMTDTSFMVPNFYDIQYFPKK